MDYITGRGALKYEETVIEAVVTRVMLIFKELLKARYFEVTKERFLSLQTLLSIHGNY
jgi:hypothetical protein